jgi:hypothetical protein
MWLIDPALLCREHLLGEHNELHKLVGGIRNHPHGKAIADGQADDGNIDTSQITDRHTALVAEMNRRNYNHDSPLQYDDDEYQAGVGVIDPSANRRELRNRCDKCAERIVQ